MQADLAEAQPELDAAKKALADLDRNSVVELRGFNNPHEAIVTVMEAVCVLFGQKTDWNSARQFMADVNAFLDRLRNYDVSTCPEPLMNKIRKNYLSKKTFDIEAVGKKSLAA